MVASLFSPARLLSSEHGGQQLLWGVWRFLIKLVRLQLHDIAPRRAASPPRRQQVNAAGTCRGQKHVAGERRSDAGRATLTPFLTLNLVTSQLSTLLHGSGLRNWGVMRGGCRRESTVFTGTLRISGVIHTCVLNVGPHSLGCARW